MRNAFVNGLLVAIVAVLCIASAEVILRVFPSLMPEEAQFRTHLSGIAGTDTLTAHTVDDPEIGYLYRPFDTGVVSRGDFSFVYRTDGQGFRNPTPTDDDADVIVLGNSMAFGYGVADDLTWTSRLAVRRPDLDIRNLGLVGAAPQQFVRIFERYGIALEPELAILMLFPGNDISGEERFIAWLRDDRGLSFVDFVRAERGGGDTMIERGLERSYLRAFWRVASKTIKTPFVNRTIVLPSDERLVLVPSLYEERANRAKPGNPEFELVMRSLEQARELANANDIPLLIVLMPTKEEVYLPVLGGRSPSFTGTFKNVLERRNFEVIDLTPILIESAKVGPPLYFEVDGHPNAVGYEVIANVIEPFLPPPEEDVESNGSK